MPTIKRKVEMNLPQLIEWGFKQKELPPLFYGSREGSLVQFAPGGWVNITGIEPTDLFTVEVEEEITEDTVIPKILVKTNYDHTAREYCNSKINQFLSQYYKAFYIVNDDLTMTLIWKNGKLVE